MYTGVEKNLEKIEKKKKELEFQRNLMEEMMNLEKKAAKEKLE